MFARIKVHSLWYMAYGLLFLLFTIYYSPSTIFAQSESSALPSTINNKPLTDPQPYAINHTPSTAPLPSTISPTSPYYTDILMHTVFHTFSCLMIGQSVIGSPCLSYQVSKNAQGMIESTPVLTQVDTSGGALGLSGSLIGALYTNRPIQTAAYLASLGEGMGVVKKADAQVVGSGAGVLDPIFNLWKTSRNIAYLLMIIIFMVIGIMIMFRQKLNPQTVITAQAALPGLVIGLILVTFSYFLAGFISDVAFIGTNLVGYYFSTAAGVSPDLTNGGLLQQISNKNIFSIFSRFMDINSQENITNGLNSVWDSLGDGAQTALRLLAVFTAMQTTAQSTTFFKAFPDIGDGLQAAAVGLSGLFAAANPVSVAGGALYLIAILVLLYAMFRLFMRLLTAYLTIIFLTISAPFQFMMASLPGRQGTATSWIRKMFSNVLIFPAVIAVFYFIAFIIGPTTVDLSPFTSANTNVQIAGNNVFPLFGGIDLSFIRILLAFGALIALPTIPDLIVKSLGGESQAGGALGGGIMAIIGGGRGYANQAQGGVGALSNQGARLRGFSDTKDYHIIGTNADGSPKYGLNPFQSRPGILGRYKAKRQFEKQKADAHTEEEHAKQQNEGIFNPNEHLND